MNKYKFRKYNRKFVSLFEKEKTKLEKLLLKDSKIKHVGSTAVPGLCGKGIIDILVIVPNKDLKASEKILLTKYKQMKTTSSVDRIAFKTDYWKLFGKRRVHIHLTYPNSKTHKETINFRDNLRESEKLRKEYSDIKKDAVRIAKGEGAKYRALKEKFLKENSR